MIQYLAGIFDSEGYVRIRKIGNSYTLETKVYMTSREIIQQFSQLYNVPIKSVERGRYRKTAYYISFGTKQLRECSFIDDVLPFLNEKRQQLQEIKNIILGQDKLLCYENYLSAKKDFSHVILGEPSPEYLAGIIDGDGWFSMFNASNKKESIYNSFSVGLQQRYRPLIEYMTRFGGSGVQICKVYDYQSHVQTYSWQCNTAACLPLLESIEPFLIEKKTKCQLLIKYIREYEKFRNYSSEIMEKWN